jgi:hypothetical protein
VFLVKLQVYVKVVIKSEDLNVLKVVILRTRTKTSIRYAKENDREKRE